MIKMKGGQFIVVIIICLATSNLSSSSSSSTHVVQVSRSLKLPIYHKTHPKMKSHFDTQVVAPFEYGGSLYYMELLVGTPPIPNALIFDTGSTFTWIKVSQDYDPFSSSTSYAAVSCSNSLCKDVPDNNYCQGGDDLIDCEYNIRYADGSTSQGDVARDKFYLFEAGGLHPVEMNMTYGGGTDGSSTKNGTVGVSTHPLGLITALNVKHMSICFPKPPKEETLARFGRDSCISGESTPLVSENYKWSFVVESISVEGSKLSKLTASDAGQGGTFVFDTGAAVTYLNPVAMDGLIRLVKSNVDAEPVSPYPGYELCYDASARKKDLKISFELAGGGSLDFQFDNIWEGYFFDVCLAFRRSSSERSILGAKQMVGWNYGIDLVTKQLYFDKVDC